MAVTPSLFIDQLYGNPAAQVFIQHPVEDDIQITNALVEADFPLNMGGQYSDSDEGGTMLGTINKVQQGLANFTGGSQRVLKVVQQTFSQWNGLNKPQFTLPITLVKYRSDFDILDQIAHFYAGLAPTFDGPTLRAPLGYGLTGNGWYDAAVAGTQSTTASAFNGNFIGAQTTAFKNTLAGAWNRLGYQEFRQSIVGTWSIQYSTWFRASKLVLTEVNGVISKETAQGTNSPLYAKLNLTFMPAILPSREEVLSWFIKEVDYSGVDGALGSLAVASMNTAAR